MKIYTSVTYEWDKDQEKYVEIDSESYEYDGPMVLCNGSSDDGGLTSAQKNTLNKQKRDVRGRKKDVSQYFAELGSMAQQERTINNQSRIDDFLTESYLLDKKEDQDITKAKGLTNFETLYDQEKISSQRKDKFDLASEQDKIDFTKGTIERNKARFDQLASLEDMIYQIDTELQS